MNERISKEIINKLKEDRKEMTWKELSKKYSLTIWKIKYVIDENYRLSAKNRAIDYYKNNHKIVNKEKKKNKKIKKYQVEYHRERYNNDPEFRKKQIKASIKSREKRWKKKN